MSLTVAETIDRPTYDPARDGAVYDGSTDAHAAIMRTIERALKDSGSTDRPSARILLSGPLAISDTITIPHGASIVIEGRGTGYGEPGARAGSLRWTGAAGIPMIDASATIGCGLLRVRCIGNDTNIPSAVWYQTDLGLAVADAQSNWIEKCQLGTDRYGRGKIQRGFHTDGITGADRWVLRDTEIVGATVCGIDNSNTQATWSIIDNTLVTGSTTAFTPIALRSFCSITAVNFNANRVETVFDFSDGAGNITINFLGAEHFNKLLFADNNNTNITICGGYAQMHDVPAGSNFFEVLRMGKTGTVNLDQLEFRGPWPSPRAKLFFEVTQSGNSVRINDCEGFQPSDFSCTVSTNGAYSSADAKRFIVEGRSSAYDIETNAPDTSNLGGVFRNILTTGDTAIDSTRWDAYEKFGLMERGLTTRHTIDAVSGRLRFDATPIALRRSGTTAQRPTLAAGDVGAFYWDTTLGKPIWWDGADWVDATGASI